MSKIRKYFSLIILSFLPLAVNAQELLGQAYIQKSVIGLQKGYGISLINKKGLGLGAVYQSSDGYSLETDNRNYPFTGIEVRIPIQSSQKLSVQFVPKLGFVNDNFLVFLPEIQTELEITKSIEVAIGAGIRMREAATSIKLLVYPFK